MTTRVGSPKTIPKVKLSPQIRQKITTLKKKISPTKKSPTKRSPIKKSPTFKINKGNFYSNPQVNPETNRKIKINGPTYKKLVTKYGPPNYL